MANFSKRMFGMYGGQEETVRLRMHNRLIQVVADRFGSEVMIQQSGTEHFTFTAKVTVSPQFFSWLLGFGADAQVLAPESVVHKARQLAQQLVLLYKKQE